MATTNLDTDPYRLAIVAAERLRAALTGHGITIPSLRGSHPAREVPMVELGCCSAEVVEALAAALERVGAE
ncbi:hypothetical protein ACEZDB_25295 [Streptacidiphilus sp. N1-3]|uniref:Uncharacterized protein n=1 Tax=Streptacidiphilus alkalitolerans TaxID=3342712 RepID=A0ABV6X7K0_9ACTN